MSNEIDEGRINEMRKFLLEVPSEPLLRFTFSDASELEITYALHIHQAIDASGGKDRLMLLDEHGSIIFDGESEASQKLAEMLDAMRATRN